MIEQDQEFEQQIKEFEALVTKTLENHPVLSSYVLEAMSLKYKDEDALEQNLPMGIHTNFVNPKSETISKITFGMRWCFIGNHWFPGAMSCPTHRQ